MIPLALLTLAVYSRALECGFVNFDDDIYVTENARVQAGLDLENLAWAFRATEAANWHPLTWLSYMLDQTVYGLKAWGYHLTSVFLHLLNALLLFVLLLKLTDRVWPSAFAAALFALHPLHVESVVWISERKDVLSTLFWLLTMSAYVWYTEQPGVRRYVPVVIFFGLGLMSKPMLVTLPFALLLLDYWPLRRLRGRGVILEKVPLFLMSAASSVVTYVVQQKAQAVETLAGLPFAERAANSLVSYVAYLGKTFWPSRLAVYYPHPEHSVGIAHVALASLFLAAVTLLVIRVRASRPYLVVGWLWYVGTLFPVIGLVQVGRQAMADRYTYVPLIGIFMAIAWWIPDVLRSLTATKRPWGRDRGERDGSKGAQQEEPSVESGSVPRAAPGSALSIVALACILALSVLTYRQIGYWRDSITLFEHALAVTRDNSLAHNNLGIALSRKGDWQGAIAHYQEAIRIEPRHVEAVNNLGAALEHQGRLGEAIEQYRQAVRIGPDYGPARLNLADALRVQGQLSEAVGHYRVGTRLMPGNAVAHNNLGTVLAALGSPDEALAEYEEAVSLQPGFAGARLNLGVALARQGRLGEAVAQLSEAVRLRPDHVESRLSLGAALAESGRLEAAVEQFREAVRLAPSLPAVHENLAIAYCSLGRYDESWNELQLFRRLGGMPNRRLESEISRLRGAE